MANMVNCDQARLLIEQEKLRKRRVALRNKIVRKIEEMNDEKKNIYGYEAKSDIQTIINAYESILNLPTETKEDIAYAEWYFNDGELQPQSAVNARRSVLDEQKKKEELEKIRNSPEFKKGYHPYLVYVITVLALFPFAAVIHPILISLVFIVGFVVTWFYELSWSRLFHTESSGNVIATVGTVAVLGAIANIKANKSSGRWSSKKEI